MISDYADVVVVYESESRIEKVIWKKWNSKY